MSSFITIRQGVKLSKIGIDTSMYFHVDEIIDEMRKKFNVIIYNTAPPYVSPKTMKIVYGFSVKVCNTRWGWNARMYLGQSKWYTNIYTAKKEAINIAIKWILSHKSQKSK